MKPRAIHLKKLATGYYREADEKQARRFEPFYEGVIANRETQGNPDRTDKSNYRQGSAHWKDWWLGWNSAEAVRAKRKKELEQKFPFLRRAA